MEPETTAPQSASRVPPRRSGLNPRPQQAIVGTPQAASRGGRGRLLLLVLAAVAAAAVLRFLPVNQWLLGFVAWIRGAGTSGMAVLLGAYAGPCPPPPPGHPPPLLGGLPLRRAGRAAPRLGYAQPRAPGPL